jgi:hypothetical protein
MPRLTKEDWQAARERWEGSNISHEALALELGVSKQAVSGQAKRNNWVKINVVKTTENVVKNVVKSNVDNIKKTTSKSTLPKKINPEIKENIDTEIRGKGQPTLYRSEYDEQAYKLCLLGATDYEIADFFIVTEQTINNWKSDYPQFFESMRRGKILADANVSEKLYHRALGYSHEDEKLFLFEGEVIREDTTKHYPPDTAAARLWLLNRRPKDWRATVERPIDINLNIFPPREVLDAVYDRALEQAFERDKFLVGRRERLSGFLEQDIEIKD